MMQIEAAWSASHIFVSTRSSVFQHDCVSFETARQSVEISILVYG